MKKSFKIILAFVMFGLGIYTLKIIRQPEYKHFVYGLYGVTVVTDHQEIKSVWIGKYCLVHESEIENL